jgi:hypothetical protein
MCTLETFQQGWCYQGHTWELWAKGLLYLLEKMFPRPATSEAIGNR